MRQQHQLDKKLEQIFTTPFSNSNPTITRFFSSLRIINNEQKHRQKSKTARAMAKLINTNPCWSNDVESSLKSLSSDTLSKTTFFQTFRLIKFPDKALSFFNWADQKMGFVHTEQSFFMMLEKLGQDRNLNVARNFVFSIERRSRGSVRLGDRFFNSLIRSYGSAGLFQESVKVFERMKEVGVCPSVVTFNSVLSVLLRRGRTGMARDVYEEMLKTYGVAPDVVTFNTLIRGFCVNGMVDEGFWFFKEMRRLRCEPDVVTFNTLVDGLCKDGRVAVARNVVKGMSRESLGISPNVVTYTTLIRGYCMKRLIDEALDVFEEMVGRGLKPNQIAYNTLVKGLSEAQRFDKIKEILGGMQGGGEGFTPDTCTFNTLINTHCNSRNLDEALKMFGRMRDMHIPVDSATYSVLIRTLCLEGKFEMAEELFDELSEKEILLKDVGCTPLMAAYNPMFDYLCGNQKTKKAERVFRQLMKRGIHDPPSYRTLIMGHCKDGTVEAGFELLVLMLRRDFVPEFETYELLINGLLEKGKPLLAHKSLEKMLKSSHVPKTTTFHCTLGELLDKGFARESADLLGLMLENKIRPTISLSTRAVKLVFISKLQDKAFLIVKLLYESGFSINMDELIDYLCQNNMLLDAYRMLMFSFEKHQSVDTILCNTAIEGLCKRKRLLEAFNLCYELVEKGIHEQLSCLENLRFALEAGGRKAEAEFIYKKMQIQKTDGA